MTDLRKAAKMAFDLLCDAVEPTATQVQADIGMCAQWDVDAIECIETLRQALAEDEKVSISRCKQCGGALPVTGALDRTGECDCIRQLRVFSTIAWFNAPIKTEWGEDMMCASVSIDKNHTLTLYCERSQIHKVPNIIKELL